MRIMSAPRWIAFALALGAGATSARAADQALIAAAQKEGEVIWYTGLIMQQAVRPQIEAFQRKYPGVTVRAIQRGSSEIVLSVVNEARSGKPVGDVIDGGGVMIPTLVKAGVLDSYRPKSAEHYAATMKSADGYWTALTDNYLTAAINTDLISDADAPKTYQDLLDAKWKGRIIWPDLATLSGPPGLIGNILLTMGREKGLDYLRKLSAQKIIRIPGNQRQILDQVIAGQHALALMTLNHHAVISAERGAPVRWLKMEPLTQNFNIVSVVKNAAHPNAARLLIDFLASEDGQAIFREANYLPAHPKVDAKTPSLKPAAGGFKATAIMPEMADEQLAEWIKLYQELFP